MKKCIVIEDRVAQSSPVLFVRKPTIAVNYGNIAVGVEIRVCIDDDLGNELQAYRGQVGGHISPGCALKTRTLVLDSAQPNKVWRNKFQASPLHEVNWGR